MNKLSKVLLSSVFVSSALLISACQDDNKANANTASAQKSMLSSDVANTFSVFFRPTQQICAITKADQISGCSLGDTVKYMPDKEEKAEALFDIAAACDFSKSIVYTQKGIVCEFSPKSLKVAPQYNATLTYVTNIQKTREYFEALDQRGLLKIDHRYMSINGARLEYILKGNAKSPTVEAGDRIRIATNRFDVYGNSKVPVLEELDVTDTLFMYDTFKLLRAGDKVRVYYSFDTNVDGNFNDKLTLGMPVVFEFEVTEIVGKTKDLQELQQQQTPASDSAALEIPAK